MWEPSRLERFFCASNEEGHNKLIVEFVLVCLEGLRLQKVSDNYGTAPFI